jgi:hypothetical protein
MIKIRYWIEVYPNSKRKYTLGWILIPQRDDSIKSFESSYQSVELEEYLGKDIVQQTINIFLERTYQWLRRRHVDVFYWNPTSRVEEH